MTMIWSVYREHLRFNKEVFKNSVVTTGHNLKVSERLKAYTFPIF